MGAPHVPLADIDDPLGSAGWRVSRPDDEGALHAEVLRELCDRGLALHVGAAHARGVAATLQFVDMLQQRIVLASHDDGIAVARALQARPAWAAALLHGLRVQFALAAPCATREGVQGDRFADRPDRFLIQCHWPREIYRTSRRAAPRFATDAPANPARPGQRAPVVRLCHGHPLVSTRNLRLLDLSELGCAVLLPAGMVPPAPGAGLQGVELDLGDAQTIVTDAVVQHVAAVGRGAHRIGCHWPDMPGAGQQALRRWLAEASRVAATGPRPPAEAAQPGIPAADAALATD